MSTPEKNSSKPDAQDVETERLLAEARKALERADRILADAEAALKRSKEQKKSLPTK